jgi:hypothetical protein
VIISNQNLKAAHLKTWKDKVALIAKAVGGHEPEREWMFPTRNTSITARIRSLSTLCRHRQRPISQTDAWNVG